MNAESWMRTRRDFELLRAMDAGQRESWLRAEQERAADSAHALRELLEADAADDALLDTDAPTLHVGWLRQTSDPHAMPSVIAGYTIVAVIGEGGSATVYRGEGERTVAVKVLKSDACSPGLAKRFEQERETLAGLDHHGLIRVLGAGHLEDARPYLITEFVAGEPIDVFCDRRSLALDERLKLFVEVCRAVHHAHAHLIVHRDLKPSNILVDANARPKVLDFGVAKLLDPARDPLWTDHYGRGPLTPAFASPEQIRGESITTASDVYSLGVLLHVLVTGGGPYAEQTAERNSLERAVVEGRRRSPQATASANQRPAPPNDIVAILERALALRAADRHASAEHFAEEVVCFLEGRPLPSRSEPWTRRVARFARRRPWTMAACAAVMLVLIGSWIGTQRSLWRVEESERYAWLAHANAVRSTNMLADLLERIGANASVRSELAGLISETERSVDELADQPEAKARLHMALARLEVARGTPDAAEIHLSHALELTRSTPGLSWRETEHCLARLADLRANRGDSSAIDLARERLELFVTRGDTNGASQARADFDALLRRLGAR